VRGVQQDAANHGVEVVGKVSHVVSFCGRICRDPDPERADTPRSSKRATCKT
jgi:hypothetical protein